MWKDDPNVSEVVRVLNPLLLMYYFYAVVFSPFESTFFSVQTSIHSRGGTC